MKLFPQIEAFSSGGKTERESLDPGNKENLEGSEGFWNLKASPGPSLATEAASTGYGDSPGDRLLVSCAESPRNADFWAFTQEMEIMGV